MLYIGSMAMSRQKLQDMRRIVVKLGTRVLTDADNSLSLPVLESIVGQIAGLIKGKKEIAIVSSGAIALGLSRMGIPTRPKEINLLQAAASLGQSHLMHAYEKGFAATGCETAQILVTLDDIQQRDRYLNIRNTIFALWEFGAVPVINENDSVSFEEITFGDNDILSAHLANMIDADLLIILSDIDGLYNGDPADPGSRVIPTVEKIDPILAEGMKGKASAFSSGGMQSKLKAAQIASQSGISVVIANGKKADLKAILQGKEVGTLFPSRGKRIRGRKKWIAFNPLLAGCITVDSGGTQAIVSGRKSLLPAGIVSVEGDFPRGSNVAILDLDKNEIARGLTNFSSDEIQRIKGLQSKRIPQVLGAESYFEEVIHRDNMVITSG